MIIGIDESGSFNCNLNEYSLFCSVIIPTDNQSRKGIKDSYDSWESNLPRNLFNSNGEVKGSSLNEQHLGDFVYQLFLKHYDLRLSYSVIDTKRMEDAVVQKHKDIEVEMLNFSVADFEKNGAPRRQTNYIKSIRDWMKGKNLQQYLKIFGLRRMIFDALNYSMIHFISKERESEIIDSSYLIDKDFISDQNIAWQGYFKQVLMESTKQNPLPIIDTWDEQTHPFFKRFPIQGNRINWSSLFKDNLSFEDSESYFEIRLADICGIIINRFFNKNMYKDIFNALNTKSLPQSDSLDLIVLNDFDYNAKIQELGIG